ncbi:MAG: FliA/WhiG family RNA polymerase sigma factor [Desulfuromonas sp.]|uniref:FliA/WhiG family RNA polymerase sigma factor n=1 Tax=Desulfuromonas sp. TaxID=892 RepID=UPI000CBAD86A|nr:FliA/WhiG family RNA polymerase sigma factor [Desulfuromonas sp.]PLX84479.1 MAG: FliA/WhiG family RNA polymerase sigma factor [Desulfuromonas sp.]
MYSATAYPQPTASDQERLIMDHLPLVQFLVDRMTTQVPSFMTRDDITSAASMGLMDAARRFDPSKGILFKTFAERRIRGAIFDEVRKMDWFSRSMRDKQGQLMSTLEDLENRLGRSPAEDEIAEAMGLELEDYQQLLGEVSHLGCVSLNETMDQNGEDGKSFLDALEDRKGRNPCQNLESKELTRELAGHLAKLSEKERLVVSLYYYEELTQKEIAEVLEVSEGRVSQLHSQALAKLKVKVRRRPMLGN